MMIKVINIKNITFNPDVTYIYIGRIESYNKYKVTYPYMKDGTIFGNPFRVTFETGSRESSIADYKVYFNNKIKDILWTKLLQRIKTLSDTGAVCLVCHCKPEACHGDIVKTYVDNL